MFETLTLDLRAVLRLTSGWGAEPPQPLSIAAPCARRQRVACARYDGAKRKLGSKLDRAVDTLGHFLALPVPPGNVDELAEVGKLANAERQATGDRSN